MFAYIVQLVRSSESMAPNKPKSAPEAPTEMVGFRDELRLRLDNKLPPKPERTYNVLILTAQIKKKKFWYKKNK